jgi:hypothetical protein
MNNPETREYRLAQHLIAEAGFSVRSWVMRSHITLEDVDAAILAALIKSVQIEAQRQGLSMDRLLREIS